MPMGSCHHPEHSSDPLHTGDKSCKLGFWCESLFQNHLYGFATKQALHPFLEPANLRASHLRSSDSISAASASVIKRAIDRQGSAQPMPPTEETDSLAPSSPRCSKASVSAVG
jgi:hypothetical protein